MALRDILAKKFPRLRQFRLLSGLGQESSLYATTTCKVCGAPLRGDEVKCPYCGTAVKVGEVKVGKTLEKKVEIVTEIIKRHFPGRDVMDYQAHEKHYWSIECGRLEKGRRTVLFWKDCFYVEGTMTDAIWGEMTVSSHNPNYDSGAEAVAEELKLYTNVNLFLSGGK